MEQPRKQTDIALTISGRLAASCAVAYMALPSLLFLLGWVRPLFSIPAAAAVAAASVLLSATIPAPTLHLTRRQLAIYLCALALSLLWLLAGGMTGITSQHADFVVRNPIYETLIRCDWPLVDAGGSHFIYYLAFWLPPALACKCFSCSDIFIINYVLTAWTGLGLALTLTVLWSRFRSATLLFLASLCLLASPIGSLGLLVFIAVRTLVHRTPVRQYFSSWTVLAGAALVLLAGIYFTSSNGNNRIRLTWQDSPFDLLQYGNWKFWGAMAGSWLLTVGVPAALLFRRFKKDALFWSALVILTLTYFIYIGSVGGYNEFCYKASSVSFFCLALLFTRIFTERVGTPRWRKLCVCYLLLAALPSLSVFAKAAPTLALTKSARLANMQREWKGHLHHPEHPWNAPLWGAGESGAFRNIYFQKAGQSAEGPLAAFSTGIKTDTEPAAVPRP
ncbi:hypothetical protein [uncultured Akkermansia sp.]|uniref:hypothetical protein n=1 Tax=uncultured Akkermansia sp. TaxID=512294 RepID=UPI00259986A7|nr:hypothetical protein [uncultured Akkermansia sp.]